ncbi:MAG TPA: ATP-binding protein [Candidatus Acidoferrum sp.]|nr:ATP-binding protein [Candidatus Acidoferrum sp.]
MSSTNGNSGFEADTGNAQVSANEADMLIDKNPQAGNRRARIRNQSGMGVFRMSDGLSMRLGAVTLAALTFAAIVFAALNFQQASQITLPYDGAIWMDSAQGVVASHINPDSPSARAGLKTGDVVNSISNQPVRHGVDVARILSRAGAWVELPYQIRRGGESFTVPLITAAQQNPNERTDDLLRVIALLYLAIGVFIFVRRWNAPRAIHFYVFCLVSFVLYSFHSTGKIGATGHWSTFDQEIYWGNAVALLLQPALLVHFALVFPERRKRLALILSAIYALPVLLLGLQIVVAKGSWGFRPWLGARITLDKYDFAYMAFYFLAAGGIFLRRYMRAPSGVLRQQLKWVTAGTFAGIVPFLGGYIAPYLWLNGIVPAWTKLCVLSLVLVPLCFGYAIIRYRLMDVDIIFKRGLAYTFAGAGILGVFFGTIALIGVLFHQKLTSTGPAGEVIAMMVAAFLFQPIRDWVQARLDRFFYRDRLDYRRTLIEFGRTLTNEVRLDRLLGSALDRISRTLLVDRLAIFLEDPAAAGSFTLSRLKGDLKNSSRSELTSGYPTLAELDLSFLDAPRPALEDGCLFYESARTATKETESVRRTLDCLQLNYFIPCRFHERTVAILGLGKTVDGDFLSTEDLELLSTIAGYVAVAVENARLYQSLEQKASQIERLKDFSESIIDSLKIGVVTVDRDSHVESWNPPLEELLDVKRNEAIGRKLYELLPNDLASEIASRSIDGHVSGIYKFPLNTRGGRPLVVNVSIAPLVGKDGARLGRLVLLDDITQRVRLEEQILQTEKLTSLGLLAAGVAHEVNTPLAVISNYIQMLAKQIPGDDPRQRTIDRIVKQTFRASEIVNNLLNFSRTGGSEFRELDLNAVLEETLSLVQHPLRTVRVNVLRSFGTDLPLVLGSTTRLQQVFLNLFMNARDAMPEGGMLEVRTGARNGSVEIEVTDTGMGIPPENLNRIFDPFFTTKASGRGTGLGLSVSYGIIKEHAGKVDVHSTPGKGTSFRLEFPVARKAAVHA